MYSIMYIMIISIIITVIKIIMYCDTVHFNTFGLKMKVDKLIKLINLFIEQYKNQFKIGFEIETLT